MPGYKAAKTEGGLLRCRFYYDKANNLIVDATVDGKNKIWVAYKRIGDAPNP